MPETRDPGAEFEAESKDQGGDSSNENEYAKAVFEAQEQAGTGKGESTEQDNAEEQVRSDREEQAQQSTDERTEYARRNLKDVINEAKAREQAAGNGAEDTTAEDAAEAARAEQIAKGDKARDEAIAKAEADQIAKLGNRDIDIDRARAAALAENSARSGEGQVRAQRVAEKAKDTQDKRNAQILKFGDMPEDIKAAEVEATKINDAKTKSEVYQEYQRRIDSTTDEVERKALMGARDMEFGAEQDSQAEAAKERVKIVADSMIFAREARGAASKHEVTNKEPIVLGTPQAEEKALARHQALGLDAVPFHEDKHGGLFHFKKNRGPKVVEAYFRVPGNDNLVVVERRKRSNGELISQNTTTTEKPIRKRGGAELPPRELRGVLDGIRVKDNAELQSRATGPLSRFLGGSSSPGDFVNVGWGSGKEIDGGANNSGGIYGDKYKATRDQMNKYKYGGKKRRGGFWFWASGGRL